MKINFNLNGQGTMVDVDPMQPLLSTLRDVLQQTATKEGCGEGECGACSVLLNNELVNTCILPTIQAEGQHIVTLEGLKETDKGRCLIDAILEAKGVQCGFCSPGMIIALYALLEQNAQPTDDEIKIALSGNLCRCTGYGMLIDAAHIAISKGGELWK
ncbi:(2Fe-2S)-binding protein [Vibrio sp. SS-MA-C1-2]|uniref:(2Fe-2S)-binding protein n=1 Tax=Vibrio sp. SS-MA-C1-2 TaxID=2908646 RepID=UPI001F23C07C|nr:(2Fe-2S)-binding protein [Vibrio sp. SS-MA-C1-2]UJF18335.1 (2Fe-2S)-binding protein [Vibrio sp. SS-MA-C1-2]